MLRAVLFDATGTLIRLREPVGETYARLARRHGVALPAGRLDDAFRRVLPDMPPPLHPGLRGEVLRTAERAWWHEAVRRTFRAADGTARFDDFAAFADAAFDHYAGEAAWDCAPGARELLRRLDERRIGLAVVSDFDHRLPGILRALGLSPPLAHVLLPGETGALKPDPAPFAQALARLGVAAGAAVVVGDDAKDSEGARRAGIRALRLEGPATLRGLERRLDDLEAEGP